MFNSVICHLMGNTRQIIDYFPGQKPHIFCSTSARTPPPPCLGGVNEMDRFLYRSVRSALENARECESAQRVLYACTRPSYRKCVSRRPANERTSAGERVSEQARALKTCCAIGIHGSRNSMGASLRHILPRVEEGQPRAAPARTCIFVFLGGLELIQRPCIYSIEGERKG